MANQLPGTHPCLDQENCGSSDARRLYDDGSSYCFSCRKQFNTGVKSVESTKVVKKSVITESVESLHENNIKDRKISKKVCEFFNVRVSYDSDGDMDAHYYPYSDDLKNGPIKKRELPKKFVWLNKSSTNLFGQNKFSAGGKKLIITEGEIDALSVAEANLQKYDRIYPVVGMSSATGTKALIENREWIRSFKEVILCLDEDTAGREAVEKAIKIIGIDKVKITKLPHKDANDVLKEEGGQRLLQCIFDAAPYIPSGIISPEEIWEAIENRSKIPVVPYPACLEGLNSKLKGMREGEITLFISGTGSGKSTMFREIMLHVLATTDEKIGIVSLEESPAETAVKLSGMVLNKNPAKEEIPLEELKIGFDSLFYSDKIILLDHQGSMNDGSIVDKLEYMCLMGCTKIFLDHITILVSEGVEDIHGNEAQDKMMNELLRLVKRHPVWIGLISHLRKVPSGKKSFEEGKLPTMDDIKGSGSIKQISFDIVSFARDMSNDDEAVRNTILMSVLKARTTSLTGKVKGAQYIYETGRLIASEYDPCDNFVPS